MQSALLDSWNCLVIYFVYVSFLIMNAKEQLRWQIIGAHRSGCTNSVIARSLGVSLIIIVSYFDHLIESMPRHVSAVIEARGENTRY